MGGAEQSYVAEAFATNWLSTVGPNIDAFENEFAAHIGMKSVALSSGTAAMHLGLRLLGVGPGDEVFCPTLTFVATANPIAYLGAKPVFLDSDRATWNLDPELLSRALAQRAGRNQLPKAVIVVHLYGQPADMDPILAACARYNVPVLEDAAEALGSTYKGKPVGTHGRLAAFSFNGNKIITTPAAA
jgi:pyridoxal phosphate-dependent aminotransferase EpsN